MNEDFTDFLDALIASGARFLIVGAHAMAAHGVPRATGDLDVWVSPDPDNAARVWDALGRFGAPREGLGVTREDLATLGTVLQIGLPPRRIDLLTEITGVNFEEAWADRAIHTVGSRELPYLGRSELIKNKRATGRDKDLADLRILEKQKP